MIELNFTHNSLMFSHTIHTVQNMEKHEEYRRKQINESYRNCSAY